MIILISNIYFSSWDTRSNNYAKASHIVDAHAAEVNCVINRIRFNEMKNLFLLNF